MGNTAHTNRYNQVHFVCFVLMAVIFPLHKVLTSVPFAVMVLNWLIRGQWAQKWELVKTNRYLWWFLGYYALVILGLLYTSNLTEGLHDVKLKISILLLPLVAATSPMLNSKQFRYVLLAFVVSCFASTLWAYVYAIIQHNNGLRGAFYYQKLMKYTNIHPTYQAMYMIMAVLILLYDAVYAKVYFGGKWWQTLLGCYLILHLTIFIFLLAARTELLVFFLLMNLLLVGYILRHRAWKLLLVLVVFNVAIPTAAWNIPGTHNRIVTVWNGFQQSMQNPNEPGALNGRKRLWLAGWQVSKDNLPFGTGTGDGRDELLKEMERQGSLPDPKMIHSINLHNEYLQNLMTFGVGSLLLLGMLLHPFMFKLEKRNALHGAFIGLFALSIIAETMLQTQSGVMFFSFGSALLLFARPVPSK